MKINQSVLMAGFEGGDVFSGGESGGGGGVGTNLNTGNPVMAMNGGNDGSSSSSEPTTEAQPQVQQPQPEFRDGQWHWPNGNQNQPGQVQPPQTQQPTQQPVQVPVVQMTPEMLGQFTQHIQQAIPQPQPVAQQPQFDEAAFNKQMGYPQVTDQVVNALFSEQATPQTRAAALQSMLGDTIKHVLNVSGLVMKGLQQEFHQGLQSATAPFQAHLQEQRTGKFVGDVMSAYPALKNYEPIARQAIAQLSASGFKPQSMAHAIQSVAAMAEQGIKMVMPQFSLQNQVQQSGPTNRNMPQLPSSFHGGSNSNQAATQVPAFAAIFQ